MSKPEVIEVFITKYALTKRGVFMEEGTITTEYGGPDKPDFKPTRGGLIHHGAWHATKDSADQRIRKLLDDEKAALARKMARLDAIADDLTRGLLPMTKGA